MRKVFLVLISLLSVITLRANVQDSFSCLKDLGFENISLAFSDNRDTIYASLEDPVYRGTFRGAGVALRELHKVNPSVGSFELVMKTDNIAKVAIHASIVDDKWDVDVDYNALIVRDIINFCSSNDESKDYVVCNGNKSYGKVNLTIYPIISVNNLTFLKLFSWSVCIAPAFETSLWKGNHIVIQPIIPIYNNYEKEEIGEAIENKYVQLGSVNISQDLINNGTWWSKVCAGTFHYNYLGLYADCGLHLNRYFDLGVEATATRIQNLNKGHFYLSSKNRYSALLKASYYEPRSSLEFKLTAGRFIFGDLGARLDCVCHFGEYFIGAYGIYADGHHNEGFHFGIPMARKKQKRMGRFSVRIPESFDWEYKALSDEKWSGPEVGRGKEVEIKAAKDRAAHYWQARYIKSYITKFLNGDVD